MPVEFTVYGKPEPAGSKRAFVRGNRALIVDANPASKSWKQEVYACAFAAMGDAQPMRGPVTVTMTFYRAHLAAHRRKDGSIKETAPCLPVTRPDVLKLARAVEDAMTGVVYVDDAQIVHETLFKFYTSGVERVQVYVAPVALTLLAPETVLARSTEAMTA